MKAMRSVGLVLASLVLVLAGCATPPQAPVALPGDYAAAKPGRVGVVAAPLPKPDTYFPGAGCLLCMMTAAAANSSLTTHTGTLGTDDLKPLAADLAQLLRDQGIDAVLLSEPVDVDKLPDRSGAAADQARKDFSALRKRHNIDRVLVVQVESLGFTRPYSAYFPAGAPRAFLKGQAFLVNLDTHRFDWYLPLNVERFADTWDESPKYPGLTNAYFQVVETALDNARQPFQKK